MQRVDPSQAHQKELGRGGSSHDPVPIGVGDDEPGQDKEEVDEEGRVLQQVARITRKEVRVIGSDGEGSDPSEGFE